MAQGGGEAGRNPQWDLTDRVIGASIEVHRHLGPGLLESAYEACLCHELELCGIRYVRQHSVPIAYKGRLLDCDYRLDLLIEDILVVELKAVAQLLPIHEAQVITYLRVMNLEVGLLINFNVAALRTGIRRLGRTRNPSPPPRLPVPSDW